MNNILPTKKNDKNLEVRLGLATDEETLYYFDELISWLEDPSWGNTKAIGNFIVDKFELVKDLLKKYLSSENKDAEFKQNILETFFYEVPLSRKQWTYYEKVLKSSLLDATDFAKSIALDEDIQEILNFIKTENKNK